MPSNKKTTPSAAHLNSPRGDTYKVIGAAKALAEKGSPGVPTQAGGDLLVIKDGAIFMCTSRSGDIRPGEVRGEGLYSFDTRYLSELRLKIGDALPVLLGSSADLSYAMVVEATNPDIWVNGKLKVRQQSLSIRRYRFISDRLYERVTIRNFGELPVKTTLELTLAADFADMFEVRGVKLRRHRGQTLEPKQADGEVTFGYLGEDDLFRETLISFDPPPDKVVVDDKNVTSTWRVEAGPREERHWVFAFEPSEGGKRRRTRSFKTAETQVASRHEQWRTAGTSIVADNELFNKMVRGSVRDLCALVLPVDGGEMVAAGIPWYVAPFGRDALITAYEMLSFNPAVSKDTLSVLARYQASEDDPWRDAEPGKVLHEIRYGELAKVGYIPHTPYFGSVDSSPLFLMLAAAYYRWTSDLEFMSELKGPIDAALKWIDDFGDADGDGFVEYERRSEAGLINQGWKDSREAIVHLDGRVAEGSIALVEVQGYVYLAKLRIADVYDALGEPDVAEALRKQAAELKEAFNEAFWVPSEGNYALALDGKKKQVASMTSNVGHCFYCDIVDVGKSERAAERLMAPDMFSGWGIRTLSSDSPAFNPMGYHLGTVWPHDNVVIAAGLKRYGFVDSTERIATALFDAAIASRDFRLPELYCGFQRREGVPYVSYPVACSPQAWSAAVPFMMLQSLLGISARAQDSVLSVNYPRLPEWLRRVEMHNIRVGDSKVSLAFSRDREKTYSTMIGKEGDVRVTIEQ